MNRAAPARSESARVGPGIREIAAFVGADGERFFSMLHTPAEDAPRAGLTLAPSLLTDRVRTYRAEVELARALAARGVAVQRFDYRGFGHSDEYTATSSSMLEDMRSARSMLEEVTGSVPSLAMGIGWGALVAACASPSMGLILWEPPVSGDAYLKDAKRAHRIAVMGSAPPRVSKASGSELLGFDISSVLQSSAGDLRLESAEAEHVLWITTGKRLASGAGQIAGLWRESGSAVDEVALGTEESWWFIQAGQMRGADLVGTTVDWVEELLAS